MTIERKTVVDQLEIGRGGELRLRLGLLLVDGDQELACRYHRTGFDMTGPSAIVDMQMELVNTHLIEMGELPVGVEDILKIKAYFDFIKSQV